MARLHSSIANPFFGVGVQSDLMNSDIKKPILVSGTDGVGTKLRLAIMMGKHDTVGQDCVAMSINDVLVQGAEPLFFLDYIAVGKLDPVQVATIVKGVAHACQESGCALLGGETAEMAGFYAKDDYDLAGFGVGIVDRDKVITGENIKAGDVLIGLRPPTIMNGSVWTTGPSIKVSCLPGIGLRSPRRRNGWKWPTLRL